MNHNAAVNSGKIRRVFLRVPVKLPAQLIAGDDFRCDALVDNISAEGMGVIVKSGKTAESIPHVFRVRVKLKNLSDAISAEVEQKNRTERGSDTLISCAITALSPEDKKILNRYLYREVRLGVAYGLVDTAAFLCCADSLWRMSAYAVVAYYAGTEFGKGLALPEPSGLYGTAIALYGLTSFLSFFFINGFIRTRRYWWRFPLGMAALLPAAVFLAARVLVYANSGMMKSAGTFIAIFLWMQFSLFFYLISSIAFGIMNIKKVRSIFSALETHY